MRPFVITSPEVAVAKYCDEYVCLSVCEDISATTCAIFANSFVHVAYVRGSVLFRQVYDRPHHVSPGRGFLPHLQCIYLRSHTLDIFTNFLCMLPISEALSFSDMFTIGRIAYRRVFHFSSPLKMHYRRERGDRSTQHERSVIYDCFVTFRVSRRRREMYCGHARLCVCLSVRGRMPTLLHGPGCNLGEW